MSSHSLSRTLMDERESSARLTACFQRDSRLPREAPKQSIRERDMTEQKVAVVTGASRGIGFSIAKRLGERGMHVILISKYDQVLDSASRLAAEGVSAEALIGDASDKSSVRSLVAKIDSTSSALRCPGEQRRHFAEARRPQTGNDRHPVVRVEPGAAGQPDRPVPDVPRMPAADGAKPMGPHRQHLVARRSHRLSPSGVDLLRHQGGSHRFFARLGGPGWKARDHGQLRGGGKNRHVDGVGVEPDAYRRLCRQRSAGSSRRSRRHRRRR